MRTFNKKIIILLISLVSITFLTGCTNWKKKYNALNVEHQNTLGLLAHEKAKKRQKRINSPTGFHKAGRQLKNYKDGLQETNRLRSCRTCCFQCNSRR